jgi:hypothetical protein
MTAIGPSRHFALRINCVALGAKRTSASVGHATFARVLRDARALSASSREVPRKPMVGAWLQMTLRSPLVATRHKRVLSRRWAIQGHPLAKVVSLAFRF